MLNEKILKKLESLRDLPTIPIVISEVLELIDNPKISAYQLAQIIEKDQALTARVLRIANSPYYGFSRKISTIDLAIVIMGFNTLKEIVLSLVIRRFFSKVTNKIFNIKSFWHYGLFCASSSRLLAKKLGYKIVGEAFVAGLMHDIGILIIAEYFSEEFKKIKYLVENNGIDIIDAEFKILGNTHTQIGSWIAEKWNLPEQIINAINNHHTNYKRFLPKEEFSFNFDRIDEQLTAIVSISEWLSAFLGFKDWIIEKKQPEFYLSDELFPQLSVYDFLDSESSFFALKQELIEEYNKAGIFSEL